MQKGILCKVRHYTSTSILKNVYLGLVYPYLQNTAMTWWNTTAGCLNKIQTKPHCLIKVISSAPLTKTKLSPLYKQLRLLKLNNIHELEVLKFACKFKMKTLSGCFENYFQLASRVHIYSTRFAANENWSLPWLKNSILNIQLDVKALNCGMHFLQT